MSDESVQELNDVDADALVGSVDATDPVDVEPGDGVETSPDPSEWDDEAHAEEFADDPAVVVTPDPPDDESADA